MTKLTLNDTKEAQDAARDILFMVSDIQLSYGRFGHGIIRGTFDPFKFIHAECPDNFFSGAAEQETLRRGALIKILCEVYDAWCEQYSVAHNNFDPHRELLAAGGLREFPEAEDFLRRIFAAEDLKPEETADWVEKGFDTLHALYIGDYFAALFKS